MAYGLVISNPAGELVVDSDTQALHYVGTATFVAVIGAITTGSPQQRGLQRYSITLPSSTLTPFVTVKPATDRAVSIQKVARSAGGSATWYIDCFGVDTTGSLTTSSFGSSPAIEVKVFTQITTANSGYGLVLSDASGVPRWDFSKKPAMLMQYADFPVRTPRTTYVNGDAIAIAAGITTPMITGRAHGKDNVAQGGIGSHNDWEYMFSLDGSGNIIRMKVQTYFESGSPGDPPYSPQPDWALPAQPVFVLDSSMY